MDTVYRVTHLIDGAWTDDDAADKRVNPADPADVVVEVSAGTPELVDAAVNAAAVAQEVWAGMTGPARGAVLSRSAQLIRDRVDQIARDLTREEGKTLPEAIGEVRRAADILD